MESKKGRLSRSEKMKLMINNYKKKLEEEICALNKGQNKSQDDSEVKYSSEQINIMNEKLSKYILEIKKKYKRKKKSKSQLLIEFEYKKLNELREKYYKLQNEKTDNNKNIELQIKQELSILVQNKKNELSKKKENKIITIGDDKIITVGDDFKRKKKKRKKTKKKRLDARRIEFVKKLKQKFSEITENEINNRLEDYTKYESKILEDDIEFNKRLRITREKLEKECDTSPETLENIKKMLIKNLVKEKKEFLEGIDTNIDDESLKANKQRILNMKDNIKKIDNIIKMSEDILNDDSVDKNDNMPLTNMEEKTKKNNILEIKSNEILLKKYENELEEKYKDKRYLISERFRIIKGGMKVQAALIKKEIEIERKLKDERELITKKWSKMRKYKNNREKLKIDIDNHIRSKEKRLKEYSELNIDPDEHDKISIDIANKIWREVQDIINKNVEKWNMYTNKQKLEPFVEKYKTFSNSFPIILKYMIFENKYNNIAFKRFLKKCRDNVPPQGAKHSEIEDVKFQNQSSYIQYLYEEAIRKGKGHINNKISKKIFNDAYTHLRKEKMSFEEKYEETKEKIEEENKENTKVLLVDLLKKIKNGETPQSEEETKKTIELLKLLKKIKDSKK